MERMSDPAEVFERQAARGGIVPDLCDLLDVGPGDAVLEVGSGPGHTALRIARRVAPGSVYAVDRDPAALRFLRRKAAEEGVGNAHPVATDAGAIALAFDGPVAVIVAFVLHHAAEPPAVLAPVAEAVSRGAPLLVVEYHPDADGRYGPSPERRIPSGQLRGWLVDAGFSVGTETTLPEEKYALRAGRR